MTTDTLQSYARKVRQTQKNLTSVDDRGALAAGLVVKRGVLTEMATQGVRGRLSGVGRNGARVGVRAQDPKSGEVIVRATGPFQLIEFDTKAHIIGTPPAELLALRSVGNAVAGKRVRRSRKRKVVRIGGGGIGNRGGDNIRAYAKHPGTKGKQPFFKGVAASAPLIPKAVDRVLVQALKDGLS